MTDRPCGLSPAGLRRQRGVGLMEIVVATVIAVIAVTALAYTFGTGRGLVDRYAAARLGLGAAQRRLEILASLPATAPELQFGTHGPQDVVIDGRTAARETWWVIPWDDPADGVNGVDLRRVTVSVNWSANPGDTLTLQRLLPLE